MPSTAAVDHPQASMAPVVSQLARADEGLAHGSLEESLMARGSFWRSLAVAYFLVLGAAALFPHGCAEPRSRIVAASLMGVAGVASSIEQISDRAPGVVGVDPHDE